MKKKKTAVLLIFLLFVIAGIGIGMYYQYMANPVSVYPVTLLKSDWENYSDGNTGVVGNHMTQRIVIESGMAVEKLHVTEGQAVKAGDKILEYDMEEKEIDLELKEYDVKEVELSIQKGQENLRYIWSLEEAVKNGTQAGIEGEIPSYTLSEIWEMEEVQKEEIEELKLQLKEAQLEYETLKKAVEDAVVTAAIDGHIKTINTMAGDGEPIVVIASEEQLSIQGTVDEFYYLKLKTGMKVTAVSWETGKTVKATITELSSYPVTASYSLASGNPNVSYYPFKAVIDEGYTDISAGESVTMSFDQNTATEGAGSIYLPMAYVRTDGEAPYVYIRNSSGTLKKQAVVTGQSYYNMVIEVKSGIGYEDYVAFPYGTSVKEGARTVISEDETKIVY